MKVLRKVRERIKKGESHAQETRERDKGESNNMSQRNRDRSGSQSNMKVGKNPHLKKEYVGNLHKWGTMFMGPGNVYQII